MGCPGQFSEKCHTLEAGDVPDSFLKSVAPSGVGRPGQHSEKCRTLEGWNVRVSFLKSVAPWKRGLSGTVF